MQVKEKAAIWNAQIRAFSLHLQIFLKSCDCKTDVVLGFVQLNNLLAFFSDLCTTRIYEKSYERHHTQNSLQRFFFECAFPQYIWSLLSQTLHCMKIDRYWHEISVKRILNSVYASFYSWIDLDQVYIRSEFLNVQSIGNSTHVW